MTKKNSQKEHRRQLERNLKNRLINRFREKYGFMGGDEIIGFIVDDILKLTQDYHRPVSTMTKGQILWDGIELKQNRKPGRSLPMKETKTKPIVLTLINDDDIKNLMNGGTRRDMKKDVIERITKEAIDQGTTINHIDVGLLTCTSPACVSAHIKEREKEKQIQIPTRGRIHDLGPAVTHKKEIVKMRLQRYSTLEIKRRTHHSTEAIGRYHRDFDRVSMLKAKLAPQEISFVTGMSQRLVDEYINLKEEIDFQGVNFGG